MKPLSYLVLIAGLVAASDPPNAEAIKKEMKKLEGTWVMVSATSNGKPIEEAPGGEWIFADDRLTVRMKDGETTKNRYEIDPSQKPKAINTIREAGDEGPGLGIYEFDSDTLKVCFGPKRPTEFTAKGQVLFTLKRKKP